MTDLPLALAPLSLWRPPHDVLVRATAAAGYRDVGLRLALPGGQPVPECRDPKARSALRSLLDDEGVGLLDISTLELTAAADLDDMRLLVETGAELGARFLLVSDWDPEAGRFTEHLGQLCRLASASGIRVALEFMPYSSARSLTEARTLLSSLGPENPGIVFDVLHFTRSGGTVEQIASLHEGEVAYIQICDGPTEAPPPDRLRHEAINSRLPPGEGEWPLAAIMRALGPLPPISVEVPCQALASLPADEQARRLHEATAAFLQASAGA